MMSIYFIVLFSYVFHTSSFSYIHLLHKLIAFLGFFTKFETKAKIIPIRKNLQA